MQSILQSIKPQYCEFIASGKKAIEVRKTRPKCELPVKVYIYETKGKYKALFETANPCILVPNGGIIIPTENGYRVEYLARGKGKIIGEYVCDEIIEIDFDNEYTKSYDISDDDLQLTCLTQEQLWKYGKGKTLYLWHISDLKIYDNPKDLSEFEHLCLGDCDVCKYSFLEEGGYFYSEPKLRCDNTIKRPPQSWCYVEEV